MPNAIQLSYGENSLDNGNIQKLKKNLSLKKKLPKVKFHKNN